MDISTTDTADTNSIFILEDPNEIQDAMDLSKVDINMLKLFGRNNETTLTYFSKQLVSHKSNLLNAPIANMS